MEVLDAYIKSLEWLLPIAYSLATGAVSTTSTCSPMLRRSFAKFHVKAPIPPAFTGTSGVTRTVLMVILLI